MKQAEKRQTLFVCATCGYECRKWLGKCPGCQQWDTLREHKTATPGNARGSRHFAEPLAAIQTLAAASGCTHTRLTTGISELDRVLGGGIVPGSLILLGGDPGIGKSTLILQLLAALAGQGHTVLYLSGEESVQQISMRAARLRLEGERIHLGTENCVEAISAAATALQPALVAVDSIQTMFSEEVGSAPGSVTQVREATAKLLTLAKSGGIPVILIGHVTKEGALAGPRVLEHMVDTVLYFEGERGQMFRILRTVKNRFGSTNEIGVFEMKEQGLREVANPSALFLAERPLQVPGSLVLPSIEGTRPILVEVQALVAPSNLGTGRRTAIGADPQRVALLTAVLEKKLGLSLFTHDIFVNIAGGLRVEEPALDLGVIVALLSSFWEEIVDPQLVVCGEVGLAGEIRAVGHMELRVREAERLGFSRCVVPHSCLEQLTHQGRTALLGVKSVQEVVAALFPSRRAPAPG